MPIVSHFDIDISTFTPPGSPGISDDPMLDSICFAKADEHDSMVDAVTHVALVCFCQNATSVSIPAAVSLHCDGQRSFLECLGNRHRVSSDSV